MTLSTWSWLLYVISASGVVVTGNSRRIGWWYAICNQPVYIVYGHVTGQGGSIATSLTFMAIYARNLWGLHREQRGLPPIRWGRVPVVAGYSQRMAAVRSIEEQRQLAYARQHMPAGWAPEVERQAA